MATRGGERHASYRTALNERQAPGARTGLADAATELRRLTADPSFQIVERVLADLANAPSGIGAGIEAVHALQRWGAEYMRVADELEAAARRCRLVEREINQRIDAFLVGLDERPETLRKQKPGVLPETRRRNGPRRWLRKLLRPRRGARERRRERPMSVPGAHGTLPTLPAASSRRLGSVVPATDVVALVLGPLELSVAGRRVLRWNSLKAREVFQYLLIHQDRPVRRDVLMELQWPEHTRNSARNNLNVALYSLRNTLDGPGRGVQPILYQDGCYSLNPRADVVDRPERVLCHAQ